MSSHSRPRLRVGTCKLTGQAGMFVDSHIIPEALTRPSVRGRPFFQLGEGRPTTRQWTSWYDPELVTAEGESYLSDLDGWAIATLRRHKLVWSGWGQEESLGDLSTHVYQCVGIRAVDNLDTKRLRLFFHSLLWRAAASSRSEFKDIVVSSDDLELLRNAILGLSDPPMSFYPIQLTQLSTRGVTHNQTPISDVKYLPHPYVQGGEPIALPTFRFYLDGLIAHLHRATPLAYSVESLGNLIVGMSDSLVLSTVAFEDSAQARDIEEVLDPPPRDLTTRGR